MGYSSEVRRRFAQPSRRVGGDELQGSAVMATAEDRSLNVWVRLQVELLDGTVAAMRYEAYGCPHFLAGADWVCERLEGQPVAALGEPAAREAAAILDVPTEKLGKLLVIEDALAACAARVSRPDEMKDTS